MPIQLVCLDADDTLWHNETFYRMTYRRFAELLAPYAEAGVVGERLGDIERRNLGVYGYGAKGFTLSMIETAVEVGGERLPAAIVAEILAVGRDMLRHPVHVFDGVREALQSLSERARLVMVTKGDLFHQESKLAASGLGEFFAGVEIVSDKVADTYRRIFARYDTTPAAAMMAGNSMRSDVLPALEAGAFAAFVPFELSWAHEEAEAPVGHERYREVARLGELAGWIEAIG